MFNAFDYNREPDFESGEILLFDKPQKWSSFDVVNKVRYIIFDYLKIKKIKVGHTGTLDPLATGLLILCTGNSTKLIDKIQQQEKVYEATFKLGATTPSFDLETEVNKEFEIAEITNAQIERAIQSFVGDIMQIPPEYSAIKIDGKRAYEFKRQGKKVSLLPKPITIHDIKINYIQLPYVNLTITCSKGTYIRALARDFGKKLDNGAFLYYLRRLKSGNYDVKNAVSIDFFENFLKKRNKI